MSNIDRVERDVRDAEERGERGRERRLRSLAERARARGGLTLPVPVCGQRRSHENDAGRTAVADDVDPEAPVGVAEERRRGRRRRRGHGGGTRSGQRRQAGIICAVG